MTTAVVLGAGGRVGQAYHLGVLRALERHAGFDAREADVLVGTSAGSLVAAQLAAGLSAHDLGAELLGEPLSEQGRRLRAQGRGGVQMPAAPQETGRGPLAPEALLAAVRRPWRVRPGAVAAGLLPAGRVSTEGISRGISRLHGGRWPDRDLRVCAVRVRDGQRVVFGTPGAARVDVGLAVAASCAVPAYFAPVRSDGEAYVDGGAHSPSSADVVLPDRPDLGLVLSPMSVARTERLRRADAAVRYAVRRYLASEVRRLRAAGSHVVVAQPDVGDLDVMGMNMMSGSGLGEVVRRAEASTARRLAARPDLLSA